MHAVSRVANCFCCKLASTHSTMQYYMPNLTYIIKVNCRSFLTYVPLVCFDFIFVQSGCILVLIRRFSGRST